MGDLKKKLWLGFEMILACWNTWSYGKSNNNGKLFMLRASKFIYHHDSFICDSDYMIQNPADCPMN